MAKKPLIRVLVVEDSDFMAREIARALQAHARITVVGVSPNGNDAREKVRELQPDVVTLDVHMPGMDGLTCLQYIMIEQPTPCVIVSALTGESAIETFEAYELGAVAVVEKPNERNGGSLALFKRRLAANVVRASHANVGTVTRAVPPNRPRRAPVAQGSGAIPRHLVVIGASTGGPRTLIEVIPHLPADLGAAVLVVQHMPGSFTGSFAARLHELSALPVREAEDGEVLQNDLVYVAPGDFHLRLEKEGIGTKCSVRLLPDDQGLFVVPSVDVALDSAVDVFGKNVIGVVLTGLGSDGAEAMARLHGLGGVTIAESASSAVINGMPQSVVDRGAAAHVLHVKRIAEKIVSELGRIRGEDDA